MRTVLDVEVRGLGGFRLVERSVTEPWIKDYDDCGEGPIRWPTRFDISNWGLVSAWNDATRVGGAVVAFDTPGLSMLEGRRDLAVVWDIRGRAAVETKRHRLFTVPCRRGMGARSRVFPARR